MLAEDKAEVFFKSMFNPGCYLVENMEGRSDNLIEASESVHIKMRSKNCLFCAKDQIIFVE